MSSGCDSRGCFNRSSELWLSAFLHSCWANCVRIVSHSVTDDSKCIPIHFHRWTHRNHIFFFQMSTVVSVDQGTHKAKRMKITHLWTSIRQSYEIYQWNECVLLWFSHHPRTYDNKTHTTIRSSLALIFDLCCLCCQLPVSGSKIGILCTFQKDLFAFLSRIFVSLSVLGFLTCSNFFSFFRDFCRDFNFLIHCLFSYLHRPNAFRISIQFMFVVNNQTTCTHTHVLFK